MEHASAVGMVSWFEQGFLLFYYQCLLVLRSQFPLLLTTAHPLGADPESPLLQPCGLAALQLPAVLGLVVVKCLCEPRNFMTLRFPAGCSASRGRWEFIPLS